MIDLYLMAEILFPAASQIVVPDFRMQSRSNSSDSALEMHFYSA